MKVYKDGKSCNCDKSQLDAMLAGGWSKKPEAKTDEAPEAPEAPVKPLAPKDPAKPAAPAKAPNKLK
mgnify:CR=1 FL=1